MLSWEVSINYGSKFLAIDTPFPILLIAFLLCILKNLCHAYVIYGWSFDINTADIIKCFAMPKFLYGISPKSSLCTYFSIFTRVYTYILLKILVIHDLFEFDYPFISIKRIQAAKNMHTLLKKYFWNGVILREQNLS